MKPRFKLILILLVFTIFSVHPSKSYAQATSLDLINIKTFPSVPVPNQNVNIFVESYSTDLNGASIVWIVDGKTYKQGVGEKSINLKTPPLGKEATVSAIIKTIEGKEVKKIVVIWPGEVDIVWESEGFTPPFFKGKSSYTYQNNVKLAAVPHLADEKGIELDPSTLIYKWTVNEKVLQDQSGYGKQSVTVQEQFPRDLDIEVEVYSKDGKQKAISSISLEPGDPSIIFYEDSPLYGVLYNKALNNNVSLSNQELGLRAIPYSFSKQAKLTYLWRINNQEYTDLASKESLVLRTKGDSEGSSLISLDVRSGGNILQMAKNGISVTFTPKKSSSNNFSF